MPVHVPVLALLLWSAGLVAGGAPAPAEAHAPEAQRPAATTPDTTRPPSATARSPVPLDRRAARERGLIDVRGVGDAGMALTYEQPPPPDTVLADSGAARFGQRLDALDPTGLSYRGDLSFINWESVVGPRCRQFRGEPGPLSYAFVSHPRNVLDARLWGFNLVGLANNHSQDCVVAPDSIKGARMSARQMARVGQALPPNWLWHGVGRHKGVRVWTFAFGGRSVRVAFASLYMANKQCPYVACGADRDAVLRSMERAQADLRILSLHSWNEDTQRQLVATGKDFLRHHKGDIVFGHGPHEWRDVTIVESSTGERGVLFQSLGNFLHPELAGQRENIIGRVLLDRETLRVRQVQAVSVATDGLTGSFADAPPPTQVPANRSWTAVSDSTWRSGASPFMKGAYFLLEPRPQ
jgi:poly-gamma-glutamate synthesis protein (capsule biosynthesis protein)